MAECGVIRDHRGEVVDGYRLRQRLRGRTNGAQLSKFLPWQKRLDALIAYWLGKGLPEELAVAQALWEMKSLVKRLHDAGLTRAVIGRHLGRAAAQVTLMLRSVESQRSWNMPPIIKYFETGKWW